MQGWVGHVGVGWDMEGCGASYRDGVDCEKFHRIIDQSQVRCSVFSSEKLLSFAFWIIWEKACRCVVGHIGVGWAIWGCGGSNRVGWGGSCRNGVGGVGYVGMGWDKQELGGLCRAGVSGSYKGKVGYVGAGMGGSCRGGVAYVGLGWVIYCRVGWVCHMGWSGVGWIM